MNFAIYTRKSVYSEQSNSTDNQAKMCTDYIQKHFQSITSIEIFEDEGLTGANTNRPDLARLLEQVKEKAFDFLVVYQLDRLSRNVRDFSNIYSLLEENGVGFVSIKENIDTSTPIGKAMMYVSVVFAQMERETIATRIKDNMMFLAEQGWWAGGAAPLGYDRKRVVALDGKSHVTLEENKEDSDFVKMVFRTFLDNNFSITQLQSYFKNSNIKTKRGYFFSSSQIHKILSTPYYAPATQELYDFYESKGCIMSPLSPRDKWTGSHGVMIYGRTTEKK